VVHAAITVGFLFALYLNFLPDLGMDLPAVTSTLGIVFAVVLSAALLVILGYIVYLLIWGKEAGDKVAAADDVLIPEDDLAFLQENTPYLLDRNGNPIAVKDYQYKHEEQVSNLVRTPGFDSVALDPAKLQKVKSFIQDVSTGADVNNNQDEFADGAMGTMRRTLSMITPGRRRRSDSDSEQSDAEAGQFPKALSAINLDAVLTTMANPLAALNDPTTSDDDEDEEPEINLLAPPPASSTGARVAAELDMNPADDLAKRSSKWAEKLGKRLAQDDDADGDGADMDADDVWEWSSDEDIDAQ